MVSHFPIAYGWVPSAPLQLGSAVTINCGVFLFVSFFWSRLFSLQMFFRHIARDWNSNANNRYVQACVIWYFIMFIKEQKAFMHLLKIKGTHVFKIVNLWSERKIPFKNRLLFYRLGSHGVPDSSFIVLIWLIVHKWRYLVADEHTAFQYYFWSWEHVSK